MEENQYAWVYTLAPDYVVLTREFLLELAKKLKELDRSRQGTIDWLDRRLFHDLDRRVYLHGGEQLVIHRDIIDEAYGWSDEYRWNTDVKRLASEHPQRAPNRSLLLRLNLWDLAFKIGGDPIVLDDGSVSA